MKVSKVSLEKSGLQNRMVRDMLSGDPFLKPFYNYAPSVESFEKAISDRSHFKTDRTALVTALAKQHQQYYKRYPVIKANVDSLADGRTFTVTTGHQLCLAGGPMFFIYKLITVINLAAELRKRYNSYNFVPVYWMATEDHDFAEIASMDVDGCEVKWEHESGNATGRLDTGNFQPVIDVIQSRLEGHPGYERLIRSINHSYNGNKNLAEATREFVLEFFGDSGLIVIDADNPELKKSFIPVMLDELQNSRAYLLTRDSDKALEAKYHLQINPRPVNLFYLDGVRRLRIVRHPDYYEVIDSDVRFTQAEIDKEVNLHPEKFSPNVVLRPVYQEFILPNLSYTGGPAESAYWLQLKPVFDHYGIFYPVIVPRNHALIFESKPAGKWNKLGLTEDDLFANPDELVNRYVQSLENSDVPDENVVNTIREVYHRLSVRVKETDVTLEPVVNAQLQKALNGLDRIHRKHSAALRRKHGISIERISFVMNAVKPGGVPQERVAGFVTMYAKYSDELIDVLKQTLRPFSSDVVIVYPN